MNKKTVWKGIAVLAGLAVGAGGYYAYREFNRKAPSVLDVQPVASLSIENLASAFALNPDSIDSAFRDKVIEVTGKLHRADVRDTGAYLEMVAPDGFVVQASCGSDGAKDVKSLPAEPSETSVKIRGYYYGYLPGDSILGEVLPGIVQLGRSRLVR